ncbi:similar to Saccharomyces cerevisiae YNL058C Putative protein of unknown function [Maudiozyma saulgeensis]|uniref:Vacuolar membrane protein n=1 Tax=Maudiozyma saulgeensis TaxID=1789683 RepID=A0A1X7QYX3_9SACH|nr:similar to Saccharomyces cerevisiae YNL058C Putative protein of unknown function [Kazachstania saulgeensis]
MESYTNTNLLKRGLPKLVTTTTSSSLGTYTSTVSTIISSVKDESQKSTAQSISSSISLLDSSSFVSSSSIVTPTITPPSPNGNPHIAQMIDLPPRGTVFIAVGACVGAIFLAIFVWWAISTYISHQNTKYNGQLTYNHGGDVHNSNSNYNNGGFGHRHQNSLMTQITSSSYSDNNSSNFEQDEEKTPASGRVSGKTSIFNLARSNTREPFIDDDVSFDYCEPEQQVFNVIQDEAFGYNNRSSLFISPTLEVSQKQAQYQRRNSRFGNLDNAINEGDFSTLSVDSTFLEGNIDKPKRAASPERKKKIREDIHYHTRNKSSLGLNGTGSTPPSPTKNGNQRHNKTPSMYLEDMLTDDI